VKHVAVFRAAPFELRPVHALQGRELDKLVMVAVFGLVGVVEGASI